jgi:hypothetical protein
MIGIPRIPSYSALFVALIGASSFVPIGRPDRTVQSRAEVAIVHQTVLEEPNPQLELSITVPLHLRAGNRDPPRYQLVATLTGSMKGPV